MSLYDKEDPQHLEYRDRWRITGDRITQVLKMKHELLGLRDCGVIRCTGVSVERYGKLVALGLATVSHGRRDGRAFSDFRLTRSGERHAAIW